MRSGWVNSRAGRKYMYLGNAGRTVLVHVLEHKIFIGCYMYLHILECPTRVAIHDDHDDRCMRGHVIDIDLQRLVETCDQGFQLAPGDRRPCISSKVLLQTGSENEWSLIEPSPAPSLLSPVCTRQPPIADKLL